MSDDVFTLINMAQLGQRVTEHIQTCNIAQSVGESHFDETQNFVSSKSAIHTVENTGKRPKYINFQLHNKYTQH